MKRRTSGRPSRGNEPKSPEEIWREHIRLAIASALAEGHTSTEDIVRFVRGADPSVVREEIGNVRQPGGSRPSSTTRDANAFARQQASEFTTKLPAADPLGSQWWYTLDTVQSLAHRVARDTGADRVAFLGTPTVAQYYSARFKKAKCFERDLDVVKALNSETPQLATQWDAWTGISTPSNFGRFAAAVLDPPWYQAITTAFLYSALSLVRNGIILCSIPSLLTRPGVAEERKRLLDQLQDWRIKVLGLDMGAVEYWVPEFEAIALRHIEDFSGRPWRQGDLLTIKVDETSSIPPPEGGPPREEVRSFSRNPARLRIFVAGNRAKPNLRTHFQRIPEFERHISTRHFNKDDITIWSTQKVGASCSHPDWATAVLEAWHNNKEQPFAISTLIERGVSSKESVSFVSALQDLFSLWPVKVSGRRLTPEEIESNTIRGELAARPSPREFVSTSDGFRPGFQRDRDRVLWSSGLKRLSNKTQVFSFDDDDNVRQRLAHSAEVTQLASTIGASFGLDLALIEAGAMAHDIGHTPFGHAGEYALDSIMNQLANRSGGFSHYEHGVDVVRWLEDVYRSPSSDGHAGLNLTPEISECIFKHTYCREGKSLSQAALYKVTKHHDLFKNDACHLEGQAVRVADKISYLISDLEDGIRLGVFRLRDLLECKLFLHPPIDIRPRPKESLLERFLSQRRALLKILMEDVILESERRLTGTTTANIRSSSEYMIEHSREIKQDMSEVWNRLQKGILHKHPIVRSANVRSAKIVSELFLLFSALPDLVDPSFRRSHEWLWDESYMNIYRKRCGKLVELPRQLVSPLHLERLIGFESKAAGRVKVNTEHLVLAKDYVASLTDSGARRIHKKLISASAA